MGAEGFRIVFWDGAKAARDDQLNELIARGAEDLIVCFSEDGEWKMPAVSKLRVTVLKNTKCEAASESQELYQRLFSFALAEKRFFTMRAFTAAPAETSTLTPVLRTWRAVCSELESGFGHFHDSLKGIRNILENLRIVENSLGLEILENLAEGVPTIIVSTGPSLVKSLPWLKEMQTRAVLIAADASLRILLEHQIVPHLICTLERDEDGLPFFTKLGDERSLPTNLIYFPVVPKIILEAFPGPLLVAYRNQGVFGFLHAQARHQLLNTPHSVAHMCVRVAQMLKASEIILVGQDLGYDPTSFQSHAKGIAFEEWSSAQSLDVLKEKLKAQHDELVWMEGNLDARIPTSTVYVLFAREFTRMASESPIPIINATAGGLKIPGIPWKSTEKFPSDQFRTFNFFERIAEAREEAARGPRPRISTKVFQDSVHACLKKLEEFRTLMATETSVSKLRGAQESLRDDPEFFTWTAAVMGGDYLKLEHEWARADREDTLAQRSWLDRWVKECERTLAAVQGLMRNA